MQEIDPFITDLLDLCCQRLILPAVFRRVHFCLIFVQIGPHLPIDRFDILDIAFQFFRGLIQEVDGVPSGYVTIAANGVVFFPELIQVAPQALFFSFKLLCPGALTLVFAVLGQDILLLPDQLAYRHQIFWCIREIRHLLCILSLLICDLADCTALIVQFRLLLVQGKQLIAYSDHLQQGLCFFFIGCLDEFGEVESQLFNELVQKLLSGAAAIWIDNLQIAVFPRSLYDDPITQFDLQVRRNDGTIPGCL